jgi:DNA (cytosine-5)-methyltransferase 1
MTEQALGVVEICAGAGGQSLGLEKSGFHHLAAVEIDKDACSTLRTNRPDWHVIEGDVTDRDVFEPSQFEGADLLAGGVPCPPFSIAGKQLGAEDERDLFAFAVHLLERVQASALLLENVRGLAARRFAGYREHVLDVLESWGYWAEWRLLQASDFGVPQLRPRFILVALKEEYAPYFAWPEPDETPAPTVGEALYDLMAADGWSGAEAWREAACDVGPTIVGGSKKHGGADLGPTRAKRAWRGLRVDGLGIADAAPSELAPVDHIPRLTNEMVARLQGWVPEDSWEFSGRKTSTYRQIGNAFPPPVARRVGLQIRKALERAGEPTGRQTREAQADAQLYRLLADAQEDFVTLNSLADSTGQTVDAVALGLSHLEVDFLLERKKRGGLERVRLLDFKGLMDRDGESRGVGVV